MRGGITLTIIIALILAGIAPRVSSGQTSAHCYSVNTHHEINKGAIQECFPLPGDPGAYQPTTYTQGAYLGKGPGGRDLYANSDHDAIDLGAGEHTDVYAIWAGRVIGIDDAEPGSPQETDCGKTVDIYHPEVNLITHQCHFKKILVSSGQQIQAGQLIGRVDSSGTQTTGHHLHIRILEADAETGKSTGIPLAETRIISLPAFKGTQPLIIRSANGFTSGSGETLIRAGLFRPEPIGELNLEVAWPKIPGTNQTLNQLVEGKKAIDLPQVIGIVFSLALWLSALLAFVTIIYAGFAYIISGANPGERQRALERIKAVAVGAIILLTSVILLNLINPNLARLKGIELPTGGDGGIRIPGIVDSGEGSERIPDPPEISMAINGGESAAIIPGGTFTLLWETKNADEHTGCIAEATKSGSYVPVTSLDWNGAKATSGNQEVSPSEEGTYQFKLTCNKQIGGEDTELVTGSVNSSDQSGGGPVSVVLKAWPDDRNKPPSTAQDLVIAPSEGYFYLGWETTGDGFEQCNPAGEQNFDKAFPQITQRQRPSTLSDPATYTTGRSLGALRPGDYSFEVSCTWSGGRSAHDEVVVRVPQ